MFTDVTNSASRDAICNGFPCILNFQSSVMLLTFRFDRSLEGCLQEENLLKNCAASRTVKMDRYMKTFRFAAYVGNSVANLIRFKRKLKIGKRVASLNKLSVVRRQKT